MNCDISALNCLAQTFSELVEVVHDTRNSVDDKISDAGVMYDYIDVKIAGVNFDHRFLAKAFLKFRHRFCDAAA